MLIQGKKDIYFAAILSLREISYGVIMQVLMMQKLCIVGICNAILRNQLKPVIILKLSVSLYPSVCPTCQIVAHFIYISPTAVTLIW